MYLERQKMFISASENYFFPQIWIKLRYFLFFLFYLFPPFSFSVFFFPFPFWSTKPDFRNEFQKKNTYPWNIGLEQKLDFENISLDESATTHEDAKYTGNKDEKRVKNCETGGFDKESEYDTVGLKPSRAPMQSRDKGT